jgi:Hydrazine synthase alpha subunit middle domain
MVKGCITVCCLLASLLYAAPGEKTDFKELEQSDELLADWLRQDLKDAYCLDVLNTDTNNNLLSSAIDVALTETRARVGGEWTTAKAPEAKELEPLLGFYRQLCLARRTARLKTVAQTMPTLVYARHAVMGGSHYAYTEALSDAQAERNFAAGGQLCLAEVTQAGLWKETVLLEAQEGVIRDVDVDYSGKKILFSWKKSDRGDDFHLYECTLDATGRKIGQLRQLTEGVGVADYEGCYLPDGNIIFNSSRCMQIVDCWWTEVSNLYACDANGKNIRRIAFDQVHDNYPTVTWDNRVLYTRWEYNDRSQMYPQPLFQMLPDGTSQTAVYGENSWFPTTIAHARAIPGSQNIFAIATGHHSWQPGELILIEPSKGRQEKEGITRVAPIRPLPSMDPIIIDAYGQENDLFAYPYPLDHKQLLVTYNPMGWGKKAEKGRRDRNRKTGFGLYWMDVDGKRELLASRLGIACGRVVPLTPRVSPPQRPSSVQEGKREGSFYIQDVYEGEAMKGVPRGTVKSLRVVELEFRVAGIGSNGNRGPGGSALVSTPVAIGNGAWDPKILVGDAKVYEDGSVFFKAETCKPIYFMLLDEKGRMIQTMRSWTTLQQGEDASCVGCHENKNRAPSSYAKRTTKALEAGAQTLAPAMGPKRGFSFTKEIQPLLDRHCISCHDGKGDKLPGSYNLTQAPVLDSGAKRTWLQSYLTLTHATPPNQKEKGAGRGNADHEVLNWISSGSTVKLLPPYFKGSNTSTLFKMLDKGHCKTITADEIARLALWVDLGVPFCENYLEANAWSDAERAKHDRYLSKRLLYKTAVE